MMKVWFVKMTNCLKRFMIIELKLLISEHPFLTSYIFILVVLWHWLIHGIIEFIKGNYAKETKI